jgi:hypothetical protein
MFMKTENVYGKRKQAEDNSDKPSPMQEASAGLQDYRRRGTIYP